MKTTAFILTMLLSAVASALQKPTTGYAPVNGLKMYYEVHGSGDPVVLLHGSFMTISNNWTEWIGELSKTRKVGRVPSACGYCLGASSRPSASCQSAEHQHAKHVFNPSFNPFGLYLSTRQLLDATITNRHRFLDRQRLWGHVGTR